MNPVTVIKRNIAGDETWRYHGEVTRREGNTIHLEATFNGKDTELMGIVIQQGDPFKEVYFTDRWYNIFEIHDRDDHNLKGWYCNIGFPVVEEGNGIISYIDLGLDLWVAPDGTQTVLDEDEFAALELDPVIRNKALSALEEIQSLFEKCRQESPGELILEI